MTRKRTILISWIVIIVGSILATFINFSNSFQENKEIYVATILIGTGVLGAIFWILTGYQPKFLDWFDKKLKIKAP